jgi:hypothetical protein
MTTVRRPRISRTVSAAVAAVSVAAFVLGGAVSPAAAASGIEFSRDGVTFTSSLSGSLLDAITVSVPGDRQSAELYIRNAGSVAGFLRVSLADVVVSDPVLADSLTVTAGTSSIPGSPARLSDARPCYVLTEGDLVAPGGVVKVDADLVLGDLNGRDGQGGSATFSFDVSLSDAVVGSLPPTACNSGTTIPVSGGGGTIPLAMTGAEPPLGLIIGAASILGVGLFLVIAARRRRETRE